MRLPSFMRPTAGVRFGFASTALALAWVLATAVVFAYTGAIYTSQGDGTVVNQNQYALKADVYLNGGPQNQNGPGLPDGIYYFQVTDPSGGTLLSSDPASCRQLLVSGGKVAGAYPTSAPSPAPPAQCPHFNGVPNSSNGSTPVQLYPFNDTPNAGGEYKVWLIQTAGTTVLGDGLSLDFDHNAAKTDNFKVEEREGNCTGPDCPCEGEQCELNGSTIAGKKFYDANVNGTLDPGEVGIPGWRIQIDTVPPGETTTDQATGNPPDPTTAGDYEFLNVADGTYSVCEVMPLGTPTWINATPTTISGITVPPDSLNNDFGNVCLGQGGGKTLGFWSNKNGQAAINTKVPGGLAYLSGLHLRNAAGGLVVPFGSYTAFRTWILGATATNMSYMLSAQLAAMELNVGAGFVSGGSIVLAGTCGNTGLDNKFITINDLMSTADGQLTIHPTALAGDGWRSYEECLKNALDNANNNTNFVQSAPCDVNYTGLETSCVPAPALLPLP